MDLDPATARLVSAALLRVRARSPFFATLALFARISASALLPTAATDGRDIFLNPDFFAALSPAEQDGVLLHEVLHAALLHLPRRGAREPLLWNIAADIVINGLIDREPGFALPADALRDRQLERFSAEEVYDLLLRDVERHPALVFCDLLDRPPADCGGDVVVLGEAKRAALEAHWRHALDQARTIAQAVGRGDLPAGLARELDVLAPARLDWRSYLWRYLVKTPTDFGDFDRRFVGRGLYLDTMIGETVQVYVAVDTSGSVDDGQLRLLASEVVGIVHAYPHLRCQLYYADAALYGPYELTRAVALPPPRGGGGTDFRPFFAQVSAQHDGWAGALCVYLTDGLGAFPAEPPPLPVLWVVTPGGLALDEFPFGETTRLLADG
jgi:predicted metal-dependent peptidase